jgi:predicted RNA binding protein YcfA (HicA-like mRNA interferase family)
MPVLPVISGREVVRVFEKFGWSVARQRGSHIIRARQDHKGCLWARSDTVPESQDRSPKSRGYFASRASGSSSEPWPR